MRKVAFYLEEYGSLFGQYVIYRDVENCFDDEANLLLLEMKEKGFKNAQVGTYAEYESKAYKAICEMYSVGQAKEINRKEFEDFFTNFRSKEMRSKGLVVSFRDAVEFCFDLYLYFVKIENRYFSITTKKGTSQKELVSICNTLMENQKPQKQMVS